MWSLIISGTIAFTISIANSQAQGINVAVLDAFASQPGIAKNDGEIAVDQINQRAVRHFKEFYDEISDEYWTTGKDSYRVSFVDRSIKYMVDYHLNGQWRSTIRIYKESKLPVDIRLAIKREFFHSEVLLVHELRLGKVLAYFVKIRQNGWIKTVRVIDEEVAVVEAFKEQ